MEKVYKSYKEELRYLLYLLLSITLEQNEDSPDSKIFSTRAVSHVQPNQEKKGVINSIYYATFHNHLKVGNPEGIKGEQEIKKNRTIDGNSVNWPEPKEAKYALQGHKMKKEKKKNLNS